MHGRFFVLAINGPVRTILVASPKRSPRIVVEGGVARGQLGGGVRGGPKAPPKTMISVKTFIKPIEQLYLYISYFFERDLY